jgi:TonB family protein
VNVHKITVGVALALCYGGFVRVSSNTSNNPYEQSSRGVREELARVAQLETKAAKFLSDGHYDQALFYYQDVITIRTAALGENDVVLTPTLMNIALCHRARGDYAKAEAVYQRALAVRERALGPTHVDVIQTLQRYSCLMRRLGRKEEADSLSARAISSTVMEGLKIGPVTGKVINGVRISIPKPKYPKDARDQQISGSVIVNITIGEDGKVITACAVEGPPSLAHFSEMAALQALFTPTTLDGVPVKVSGVISYDFKP